MPTDKPTELSWIKLKTLTETSVAVISEHSAHSTPLAVGFRIWLWRYTCLLHTNRKWQDSNEGDFSPHAWQTIYFSNINQNKFSDRETPVELLSLEPQYGTEPLMIIMLAL